MHDWIDALRCIREAGERAVVVTVAGVRGSAPREVGAKMLVSANDTIGTIGGGELEYQCTQIACGQLRDQDAGVGMLRRFPLGINCGQCCGGVVDVLFEECPAEFGWFDDLLRAFDAGRAVLLVTRLTPDGVTAKEIITADEVDKLMAGDEFGAAASEAAHHALADGCARRLQFASKSGLLIEPIIAPGFEIAVFGAGHVGTAAVAMLATLDCNIRWIDNRRNMLPQKTPANVQAIRAESPQREVAAMPVNAYYLIMTHSHPLDYEICRNVLSRGDFAYCGLIGSLSKQRRFTKRMQQEGVSNIGRLTCPIGVSGISGKKPAEIAISVAAELLQVREAASRSAVGRPGANVFHINEPLT